MNNLETLNSKSSHGGQREGAGRPKGTKNEDTLLKEAALASFRQRVAKNTDRLFNAQLDLAIGEKYLMVKTTTGSGKERKTTIDVVTDIETIKQYIDDDGLSLNDENDSEYYFISTKPANNQALLGLLDRGFGKAPQSLDVTTDGESINPTGSVDPVLASQFADFMKDQTRQ